MTRARDLSKFANSQALSIGDDFNVGINSSVPTATLDIRGNSVITGVLTATSFSGTVDATGLTGTPDITVNNIVGAAATFSGVVTYEDVTNVDSVGVITARSDVSIADKIIHTGDTDTAIRFPAADTFTVETGGSERIRVDSSGNLGVGESSPLSLFHVKSGDSGASSVESGSYLTVESNGNSAIQMLSGTSNSNFINFGDSGDTNIGVIQYAHSVNALIFKTNASEALRITSGGDVGVGTAAPGTSLHVYHPTTNGVARFESGDANALIAFKDNSTTDNPSLGAIGNDFTIFTASTRRFNIIGSTGNIGVNQTSVNSSRKVEITQPSSYTSGLRINSAGSAGNGAYFEVFVGSANYKFGGDHSTNALLFKKDGTEYMRHDSSGRLLIGHTSSINTSGVDSQVQVVGTDTERSSLSLARFVNDSGEPFLIFAKSRNGTKGGNTVVQDDDTLGRITFQGADGTDYEEAASIKGEVDGTPADEATDMPGRLLFGTTANGDHNATERLRIDSNGSFLFNNAALIENVEVVSGKLSDNSNIDLEDGMVYLFTTAETTTSTPNIRINSSTTLESVMGDGKAISVTIMTTAAAAGYFTTAKIDGNANGENSYTLNVDWLGGSAPSAGGSSGIDAYNLTIIKQSTKNFNILIAQNNYA